MEVVDYSEKAVAVYGDSNIIYDELMKLGCGWNKNLKGRKGWICSKGVNGRNEASIRALVAKHNALPQTGLVGINNALPKASTPTPAVGGRVRRPLLAEKTIGIVEIEAMTEFEILNFLRDDSFQGQSLHELKLRTMEKYNDLGQLNDLLVKVIKSQVFVDNYLKTDSQLIQLLKEEKVPYYKGFNHFCAAVVISYFDTTFPEEGLQLVNKFVPNFDINIV